MRRRDALELMDGQIPETENLSLIHIYREAHGKRPLKEKDDDSNPPSGPSGGKEEKTIKTSTSDPESGWFHKGEHKSVFAYAVQTPSLIHIS